jgi:hypothetical protein
VAKYKDITKQIIEERIIKFDSVKLETRQGEIIPDVIGVLKGHKIFIEIFVTHRVDDKKKDYVRNKKNISCIEIDLSNLYQNDKNIEQQDLKEKIIHNIENKKWIHNVYYKNAKKKAKEEWHEKEKERLEKEEKAHLKRTKKSKERFEKSKKRFEIKKRLEKEENERLEKEQFEKEEKARLERLEKEEKQLEIENKKNYVKNTQKQIGKNQPSNNSFYRIEIDNIFKGGYIDDYKEFKIVGTVINNKKTPFEAECSVRVNDGKNFLIHSIKSKENEGYFFYEEINTTEKKFKIVILDAFNFKSYNSSF